MSEVCSKHGPYSVFCRMCDIETLNSTPTPLGERLRDNESPILMVQARQLAEYITENGHLKGRIASLERETFDRGAVIAELDVENARLKAALQQQAAKVAVMVGALSWVDDVTPKIDRDGNRMVIMAEEEWQSTRQALANLGSRAEKMIAVIEIARECTHGTNFGAIKRLQEALAALSATQDGKVGDE